MAQQYANIRRNSDVTNNHPDWTEGKEAAAQIIQGKIDNGEWPLSLQELADQTDWSRSHYQNTIRDLFVTNDTKKDETKTDCHSARSLEIPADVDETSFIKGYLKGRQNHK